jgi:hypothetical protein
MKSTQIQFFATKSDQHLLLKRAEENRNFLYTDTDTFEGPGQIKSFLATEIPTLGIARQPNAINGYSYLVTEPGEKINLRPISQRSGDIFYRVDQMTNQNSILFLHGGFYGDVLLYGRIGTISKQPKSLEIYKNFFSTIKFLFRELNGRYVGPSALEFMMQGGRLAQAIQSPPHLDLTPG